MHILLEKLHKAQTQYENNPSTQRALALGARYVVAAAMLTEGSQDYLYKATHIVQVAYRADLTSAALLLGAMELHIVTNNSDYAQNMLKSCTTYRKWYKQNRPAIYATMEYLSIKCNIDTSHSAKAKKQFKQLLEYQAKERIVELDVMIGNLYSLIYDDIKNALACYILAAKKGCRSIRFFINAYKLLGALKHIPVEAAPLSLLVIRWACGRQLDTASILSGLYGEGARTVFEGLTVERLKQLYDQTGQQLLIEEAAKRLAARGAVSLSAYYAYKEITESGVRNVLIENLLITAAYENHGLKVPGMVLLNAAKEGLFSKENRWGVTAFIYHSLIVDHAGTPEVDAMHDAILSFAGAALEKNKQGRYFNTLYAYSLRHGAKNQDVLLKSLFLQLFHYEIIIRGAIMPKYVLITDHYRESISFYAISDNKVVVTSVGDYSIYFLDDSQQYLLDGVLYDVYPLIYGTDAAFLELFNDHGYHSLNLTLALSAYYLNKESVDEQSAAMMRCAVVQLDLPEKMRIEASKKLGRYYSRKKDYSLAIRCFDYAEDKNLEQVDIEALLCALIGAGEKKRAVHIVHNGWPLIQDEVLFEKIKALSGTESEAHLAEAAYHLLMENWYDEAIEGILLRHLNGGAEQWFKVAQKLDGMGADTKSVLERIVESAVWSKRLTAATQQAAYRLFLKLRDHKMVYMFAYLCNYAIVRNGAKLSSDAVKLLEGVYQDLGGHKDTGYALVHHYITNWPRHSDKLGFIQSIAREMEANGLLFPVFKDFQDKFNISPYIEKNTPFVYKWHPGKDILFCFILEDDEDGKYFKLPMNYYKFGLYYICIPLFYNDKITYHFESDGQCTEPKQFTCAHKQLNMENDLYTIINNAAIYESTLQYDELERLIEHEIVKKDSFGMIIM